MIRDLEKTNTTSYDGIKTKIIKFLSELITYHTILSYIIKVRLEQGIFSSKLKTTIIKPVYENDAFVNMDIYRPVALVQLIELIAELSGIEVAFTPVFSEVIQKAIYKSISQSYVFFNIIYSRMEKRQPVMALYMDMTKAFNYVDHDIIMQKLEIYGIRRNTFKLF